MVLILFSFTSLVLAYISYEDIVYRRLDIRAGLLLFLIGCVFHYLFFRNFTLIALNTAFIGILLLLLAFYYSIKERTFSNPLEGKLGKGDSFFFFAVTPFFEFEGFMVFFISGMIISVLQHIGMNLIKPTPTIPLAGYLSNYIILLLILDFFNFKSLINVCR